tara:strand:- start:33 stop:494 length:462 start_codon:yes stop_codon:yes gene_type:complete
MPKVVKNKGGRPTDYLKVYDAQATKLGLLGYTDKEMAAFFCVTERTLNIWKLKHPTFVHALKAGKEVADMEVTASLYQRAKGYEHVETKVFNNQGEILTHDVIRKYPPDPISIQYWLNNRQSKKWRSKVEDSTDSKDVSLTDSISKLIDKLPN